MYPFIQTHGGMLLSVWLLLRTCIHTISLPSACPGVPQSVHEEEAEELEIEKLRKIGWSVQLGKGLFRIDRGGVKGDNRGRTLTVSYRRTPETPVVWRECVANVAAVSRVASSEQ